MQRFPVGDTPEAIASGDFNEEIRAHIEIEADRLLKGLAPKYSQALTLTKIVGLSIAESAGKLGISESAMKVRVHRGLGAMRKLLESETA